MLRMEMKDGLIIFIPSIVSCVGFYVTYRLNKRNYIQECEKIRLLTHLKKIEELPGRIERIVYMIQIMFVNSASEESIDKKYKDEMEDIENIVFAYGTPESVKIMTHYKRQFRETLENKGGIPIELMTTLLLLMSQIKYDLTGIQTSPAIWFDGNMGMHMNQAMIDGYSIAKKCANQIVEKLDLGSFLRMP